MSNGTPPSKLKNPVRDSCPKAHCPEVQCPDCNSDVSENHATARRGLFFKQLPHTADPLEYRISNGAHKKNIML